MYVPGRDPHPCHREATALPAQLLTTRATGYRRWWNNSWWVVEEGGQTKAGAWTETDDKRLRALLDYAHEQGYWIRFHTLDGFDGATDQYEALSHYLDQRDQALRPVGY